MKKILSVLLCTLFIFLIGCGDKKNSTSLKEITSETANTNVEDKNKIRDNYLETIQKQFPNDIFVAGMNLNSNPYNAELGVNYQGNSKKTMIKIAEILKVSEEFFKTQKVEYVYFTSMDDKMNDKGKLTLHLENCTYELKESTIQ
ncbi:hypothetical protein [Clostridium botulinum]|uniref:hypothetical protein n=1 Tax=Clostridium botulinum TaxID=1491 RepID=UPI000773E803|nr:hypothetical protein [Clostridium botulinum]NFE93723.1 hypothetical protein [Clostridium botulinum]NFL38965.1 hypothetical protein [Clostridium botulinum]NFL67231.1 hypothetical protein [Clostridium botulinum]NFN08696.1 hypothetical protein [Clostridium botulinum]NFN25130.1 hypothetical protein [Clostridium botulinum]